MDGMTLSLLLQGLEAPGMVENRLHGTWSRGDGEAFLRGFGEDEWNSGIGQTGTPLENSTRHGMISTDIQLFAEKDIANQESASLKRALRKYETRIAEHQKKIDSPQSYIERWADMDVREREGLKRHWQKEIRNFQQSVDDRIEELKRRGDYDD